MSLVRRKNQRTAVNFAGNIDALSLEGGFHGTNHGRIMEIETANIGLNFRRRDRREGLDMVRRRSIIDEALMSRRWFHSASLRHKDIQIQRVNTLVLSLFTAK